MVILITAIAQITHVFMLIRFLVCGIVCVCVYVTLGWAIAMAWVSVYYAFLEGKQVVGSVGKSFVLI